MGNEDIRALQTHIRHLIDTQYGGFMRRTLAQAAEEGLAVSFAVYPLETTKACEFQYEFDLYRITASDVDGFAEQIARATYDRYVIVGGVELSAEDIYCVDIIS